MWLYGKKTIIGLDNSSELSDHILNINNYLKWLNSDDCANKLKNIFYKVFIVDSKINHGNYIEIKKLIKSKKYEELEIWGAKITIRKDEKYFYDIVCNVGHHTVALLICIRGYDFLGFLVIEYKNL